MICETRTGYVLSNHFGIEVIGLIYKSIFAEGEYDWVIEVCEINSIAIAVNVDLNLSEQVYGFLSFSNTT